MTQPWQRASDDANRRAAQQNADALSRQMRDHEINRQIQKSGSSSGGCALLLMVVILAVVFGVVVL
jgi:hypothetical protein